MGVVSLIKLAHALLKTGATVDNNDLLLAPLFNAPILPRRQRICIYSDKINSKL
jgi:hypothetical protein